MDTYIHIAVGAVIGTISGEIVDRKMDQEETVLEQKYPWQVPLKKMVPIFSTGAIAGLLSHLLTDIVPHGDYLVNHGFLIPDRLWPVREFLASLGIFGLIATTTRSNRRWLAFVAGLMGGLPDIESLFIGVGLIQKQHAIFPVHNGILHHGKNRGSLSLLIELGNLALSTLYFGFNYLRLVRKKKFNSF